MVICKVNVLTRQSTAVHLPVCPVIILSNERWGVNSLLWIAMARLPVNVKCAIVRVCARACLKEACGLTCSQLKHPQIPFITTAKATQWLFNNLKCHLENIICPWPMFVSLFHNWNGKHFLQHTAYSVITYYWCTWKAPTHAIKRSL